MHKLRAKKAFQEKKANEVAEEAKKAAAEMKEKAKAAADGLIPVEEATGKKSDPLRAVVTEEALAASGSDAAAMAKLREDAEKAMGNLDPNERRFSAAEAKHSIHYPYATGPMMATFFDRMRLTKRAFYFQESAASGEVRLVEPEFADTDEDALAKARRDKPGLAEKGLLNEEEEIAANRKQRDQWYGLCRMEYVARQQQYRKKKANTVSTLRFIAPMLVCFAIFVAAFWPLWDTLLDIETNNHYATLGLPSTATTSDVKKAYRAMTKQWHPDHNPDCGQKCRDMMMKIQEAYDNLAARGKDAEQVESERENQLKAALHQIRNLIFFKAYSIAFYCAEFLNLLVLSIPLLRRLSSSRKDTLQNCVRVLVVAAFSAAEVLLVTGFNIVIILQIFYFAVNMITGTASKRQMEKWLKRSNFDFMRDCCFFVLPSLAFHVGYFYLFEKYPKYDVFFFDCALGFAYVASHLAKYTPNLFDNWALKKCSLTTQYMKPSLTKGGRMTLQYTRWNFWTSELSIVLDDLFAYTSSIPSVFRVVVIVVHAAYLVQLRLLPWDAPVTGKLGQRYRRQQQQSAGASSGSSSSTKQRVPSSCSPLDDSDDEEAAAGDFAEMLRQQQGSVPLWRSKNKRRVKGTRPLSNTEREWFTNVDSTGVLWADLPYAKYASRLRKYATPGVANTSVQLCITRDLQEILIVHVSKNRVIPSTVKDPQLLEIAKSQPVTPHFRVCERHVDPEMCRVMYRDVKSDMFLNVEPSPHQQQYAAATAGDGALSAPYRRCGGAFGYDHMDNNQVREVSLLAAGIACAGVRATEPVVSFALRPEAEEGAPEKYVELDPKNRKPWRIISTIFAANALAAAASLGLTYALYAMPISGEATLRNPEGGAANRQQQPKRFGGRTAATAFEPFFTPLCKHKYGNLLPPEHVLQQFAAGAIVLPPLLGYDEKLPIPIFGPDLWESLRLLSVFSNSNGGAGFGGDTSSEQQQNQQQQQQQHSQQQQQQQQKGGGSRKKGGRRK